MNKIKKSITLSKDINELLNLLTKKLNLTESAIINIALLEYYNKLYNILR